MKPASEAAAQRMGIITYSNFGLSYNRLHEVDVDRMRGCRAIAPIPGLNLFQLEYMKHGKMTGLEKRRSFFFRPLKENIPNADLWEEVRNGREIKTLDDMRSAQELDYHR